MKEIIISAQLNAGPHTPTETFRLKFEVEDNATPTEIRAKALGHYRKWQEITSKSIVEYQEANNIFPVYTPKKSGLTFMLSPEEKDLADILNLVKR